MTSVSFTEQCYEAIGTSVAPVSQEESRGTRKVSDLGEAVQLVSRNAGTETPARPEGFVPTASRRHRLKHEVRYSPPETGSACRLPDP